MPDLAACLAKAEMAICEARSFTSPDPDVANETRLGLLLQAESWIQEAQRTVKPSEKRKQDAEYITVTDIYLPQPDGTVDYVRMCGSIVLAYEKDAAVCLTGPNGEAPKWLSQESIVDKRVLPSERKG
jgi:hypothetical protein